MLKVDVIGGKSSRSMSQSVSTGVASLKSVVACVRWRATKDHRQSIIKTRIVWFEKSLSILWTRHRSVKMEPLTVSNQCSIHPSTYNTFGTYHNAGCSFFQNSCQTTCTSKPDLSSWRRRSYGVPERNELTTKELVGCFVLSVKFSLRTW